MSTKVAFDFIETESQYQEFQNCIEALKGQRGAQMPALQEAQRIYGYLPIDILKRLSNCLLYTSDAADEVGCVDLG
ncbi:NAD(P)H-dependent oxidoreductase subunit E, partial [Enterococcus sp. S181_ASV_20]|nr:NAD(P)H-dependent oxidoreductase subunit E [Enterococcus sp. S181_ASV_20]